MDGVLAIYTAEDLGDYWRPGPLLVPPPPPPEIPKEEIIFRWSEVMPEPVGGLSAIQSKVDYTEIQFPSSTRFR